MSGRISLSQYTLLALGFVAGALVFSGALGPFLTWQGQPTSHRVLLFFTLPATATAITFIVANLRRRPLEAHADPTADAAIDSIVIIVSLFLLTIHLMLMAALLQVGDIGVWGVRAVVVLVGLAVAAVGNLMPRTRPNAAFGIRTRLTLADRHLWILTHRVSGYIAVAVGLVTVASGLFIEGPQAAALPGIAFVAGGAIVSACYWKWTRVPPRTHHA